MEGWHQWNNAGWYPPPQPSHPHVYYPPQPYPPQGPPMAAPWWEQHQNYRPPYYKAPTPEPYRSKKYPNLNPVLAADTTTVRFDVRNRPNEAILASTFQSARLGSATAVPVTQMRLISKSFPWSVEVKVPQGSMITCELIWDALYTMLKEPLADSEWAIALGDKDRKGTVERAAKDRERKDGDKRLRRIDWLGDKTMFKGLEKDGDFEKQRLLPGVEPWPETWVVRMGS